MVRSLSFGTLDPLGAFVRRGFERAVLARIGAGPPGGAQWMAEVREQAWSIYRAHRKEYDAAGRAHLRTAAHVLAMFRAAAARIGPAEAVAVLKEALTDAYRPLFRRPLPILLRLVREPLRGIAALGRSRLLRHILFGKAFVLSATRAGSAVELHIDRCLYHQFFARCGVPELTAVICHSDFAWIDALPARRPAPGIERPVTLGWGGERCIFRFTDAPEQPRSAELGRRGGHHAQ